MANRQEPPYIGGVGITVFAAFPDTSVDIGADNDFGMRNEDWR